MYEDHVCHDHPSVGTSLSDEMSGFLQFTFQRLVSQQLCCTEVVEFWRELSFFLSGYNFLGHRKTQKINTWK